MFSLRIVSPRVALRLTVASVAILGLAGCAPLFVFGTVKTGTTIAQERTFGRAVDDLTLKTQIQAGLAKESAELFRAVNVKVIEGRVLLTGNVPDAQSRVKAARVAWQVPYVREVGNELNVAAPAKIGSYFKDLRISEQMRAKLLTDRAIAWVNYNVETVDGTVYLMGIAKDEAELKRVTEHARTIGGVKKVVSYVELKDDPERLKRL